MTTAKLSSRKQTDALPQMEAFRLLFENHPVPMLIYDLKTLGFLAVNEAAQEKYGYSRDEFLGMTIKDIRPLADIPRLKADVERARPALQHSGVWRHRLKDGTLIDVEITSHTLEYEGRQAVLVLAQNMTERTQAERVQQTEEALQICETRYRWLHESMRDCFVQTKMSGEIVDVNPAFLEMLGYTKEEVFKLRYQDITPERWHAFELDLIETQILHLGHSIVYEKEYIKKDGTVFPIELRVFLLRDAEGQPFGMWAIVRDISERKRAENALRESEERVRHVLDGLGPHMFAGLLDLQGRVLLANQPALEAAALRLEEVLGKPVESTYWWTWSEAVGQRLRAAVERAAQGESVRYDEQIRVAEGQLIWLDFSIQPLRDETGRIRFLVPSGLVVTERKQAEDALRESEKQYRSISEDMPVLICCFLPDYKISYVNRTYCENFGKTPDELVGTSFLELIPESNHDAVKSNIASLTIDAPVVSNEHQVIVPGQTIRWQKWINRAMFDEAGYIVGYQSIGEDITERKQAEGELKISENRYRRAQAIGHVGNWEYSLENAHFWGSEEAKKIYGFDPATPEFTTDEVENCIPERQRVHQALLDLIEKDSPYDLEFDIITKDKGETKAIRSIAILEKDAEGKPLKVTGVIQDITAHKQVEAALRESEERLRLAVLAGQMGIWDRDFVSGLLNWTVECKAMFGLAPETEMDDERFVQALHPEDRAPTDLAIRAALENRTDFAAEYRVIWPDGTHHWIAAKGRGYYNAAGQALRMTGVTFEITARKQAEEILQAYSSHLETEVQERTAELRQLVGTMAGREVRMAELKEVIRQLRSQMEQAGLPPSADDPLAGL